MPSCYCRLYSGCSIEDYSVNTAHHYQHSPCQEVLIFNSTNAVGGRGKWAITKTTFSLKHWSFMASLKFMQVRKLRALYRKNYLLTMLRIVMLSTMANNIGYCVRTLDWNDRETYYFDEILKKGLRIHAVLMGREEIFPIGLYRGFAPFCDCNLKIRGYVTIRSSSRPTFHFLQYQEERLHYPCETIERNGHYDFCGLQST